MEIRVGYHFQSLRFAKNSSGPFHSNGDLVSKINVLSTYPHEWDTVSFKNPLLDMFKLSFFSDGNSLFVFLIWQVHVHLGYGFNALQSHVRQHVCFNAPQEHIIVHLVKLFFLLRDKIRDSCRLLSVQGNSKCKNILVELKDNNASCNSNNSLPG